MQAEVNPRLKIPSWVKNKNNPHKICSSHFMFSWNQNQDIKTNSEFFVLQAELEQKGQTIQADNTNQRTSVEGHNDTLGQGLQKRANEYEKDRIGQGTVGGDLLGVGGPNKAERLLKNYQGDQQKATNVNNKKKLISF